MATSPASDLDPIALIDQAPEDEFALLELRIDWPHDLDVQPKKLRLWLRCFAMTGDPLAWIADRDEAWAATTLTQDVLEIDVYVLLPALRRELEASGGDLGRAVGHWVGPAMLASLRYELVLATGEYYDRAVAGTMPRLLADAGGDGGDFGTPQVYALGPWAPLGLGALQDLVQETFGAVDLDRSKVTLKPVQPPFEDCAACEGKGFDFPAGLEEASAGFCGAHRSEANAVNTARLAHAWESNPAGWRALDKAAMRINKLPDPTFAPQPPRIVGDAPSRNDPCPCGSGRKYKRCHGA
ncbi:MAG TPA: SEC-C domain-containing protein [Solirubrobacteraceae bacterium]|jgi:hypothetical protein|nr:SEC-C domain-containing protein [Solirubrobacteraceae bacterium]